MQVLMDDIFKSVIEESKKLRGESEKLGVQVEKLKKELEGLRKEQGLKPLQSAVICCDCTALSQLLYNRAIFRGGNVFALLLRRVLQT